ncbi:hypothetical protein Tco_0509689 [Tanacetum coccineum]
MHTVAGDGVAGIKRCLRDLYSDGVRNFATASGRIVLRYEKKIKFVEQPTGPALDPETIDPDTITKYYETINLKQRLHVLCYQRNSVSNSYLLKLKSNWTFGTLGYARPNESWCISNKAEAPAVLAIGEGRSRGIQKKPRGAKVRTRERIAYLYPKPRSPHRLRDIITKDTICTTARGSQLRRNESAYQAELKEDIMLVWLVTSCNSLIELYVVP